MVLGSGKNEALRRVRVAVEFEQEEPNLAREFEEEVGVPGRELDGLLEGEGLAEQVVPVGRHHAQEGNLFQRPVNRRLLVWQLSEHVLDHQAQLLFVYARAYQLGNEREVSVGERDSQRLPG